MKVSIIIPAYNEEKRIETTLEAYHSFFYKKQKEVDLTFEMIVVVNGTTDNTYQVVQKMQKAMPQVSALEIKEGGKGLAIKHGFCFASKRASDLIGFVDADMATSPDEFYKLIENINGYDGIIASRYIPGAIVIPARPLIKRWGSKLFFSSLVRLLFRINYYDTQCGAKLFKSEVVKKMMPYIHEKYWALDVELLYLARKFKFRIKEFPTIWNDQVGSKLRIFDAGTKMMSGLIKMRWYYWRLKLN